MAVLYSAVLYLAAEFTAGQIAFYSGWLVVNVTYRSFWATFASGTTSVEVHYPRLMQRSRSGSRAVAGRGCPADRRQHRDLVLAVHKLAHLARAADSHPG